MKLLHNTLVCALSVNEQQRDFLAFAMLFPQYYKGETQELLDVISLQDDCRIEMWTLQIHCCEF